MPDADSQQRQSERRLDFVFMEGPESGAPGPPLSPPRLNYWEHHTCKKCTNYLPILGYMCNDFKSQPLGRGGPDAHSQRAIGTLATIN
jgi:hypothetical protein